MLNLDLLLEDNAALLELVENHPRIGFVDAAGRIVREIVETFKDRIAALDPASSLRLRVEPIPADRPNRFAPVPAPSKLIVMSGDLRWRIDIECGETITWIGGAMIVTHKDGATWRLAEALLEAIRKALGGGNPVETQPEPQPAPPASARAETLSTVLSRMRTDKIFDAL